MAEINNVIAEASQDLQTIEDFVNLPSDSEVYPRLLPSVNVGTLAGARQAIFENGGLPATPFKTKALMTASVLVDGKYAQVTDETANNGLYVKTAGAWVKSAYDPISQAKSYTDSLEYDIKTSGSAGKNLFNKDKVVIGKYINTSGGTISANPDERWKISEYIPITPLLDYTLSTKETDKGLVLAFFAKRGDVTALSFVSGVSPLTGSAPVDSNYAVVSAGSAFYPVGESYTNIQLEQGSVATPYKKYGQIDASAIEESGLVDFIVSNTPTKEYEIVKTSNNMFDELAVRNDTFLSSTNGRPSTAAGWAVSDFIFIESGESYTISGYRSHSSYSLLSSKNDTSVISTVRFADEGTTFVAPQDCYLVIGLQTSPSTGFSKVQVEKGTVATPYVKYGGEISINPSYIKSAGDVEKASLSIVGDSIAISASRHTGENVEVNLFLGRSPNFDRPTVFNFAGSKINGVDFTSGGDETAPYYIDGALVGANHGYTKIKVTSSAHGKTIADVGSLWSANSKQFLLIAIADASTLLFMPFLSNADAITDTTLVHVSDASNAASIAVESAVNEQLYSTFKNRKLELFLDGNKSVIENSSLKYERTALFVESYELISRQDTLDFIRANVGTQYVSYDAPASVKVTMSYLFDHEGGCSFSHDFLVLKPISLQMLTMLQSAITPNTNGAVNYYVPKSKAFLSGGVSYDFRVPVDLRAKNTAKSELFFTAETLEDVSKPVDRAYQINNIGVFATGFLPVADAEPARRVELLSAKDYWWVKGSSLKTYAKLEQKAATDFIAPVGTYYSCIAFKNWFAKQAEQTACFPVRSIVGDYLYIDYHTSGLKQVLIPEDYKNRAFDVIEKSNNLEVSSNGFTQESLLVNIAVSNPQYSYLVLKFK